jgi:putative flippase GtrA
MNRRARRPPLRRPIAFLAVASGGFLIQTATVALLARGTRVPPELATALGVELAVVHNFWWHDWWTWADRSRGAEPRCARFVTYQLATGITSLTGNLLVVAIAVRALAFGPTVANVIAVAIMSVANYLVADRWVFARHAVATAAAMATLHGTAFAGPPPADAVRAWDAYIASVDRAYRDGRDWSTGFDDPHGRELPVPGGLIHEWYGSVVVPGVTVPQLLHALTTPGTPPPQDDVLESRVLARSGNMLRVYLKLQRTAIVTVTYDTEHLVTFEPHDAARATSRSEAISIREVGGGDRGFLWRLNSYWTYCQVGTGVRVDLVSVSLSRDVPAIARPVVAPIARRIARESMRRTLDAVKQYGTIR